jgi:hypothetical protein
MRQDIFRRFVLTVLINQKDRLLFIGALALLLLVTGIIII